MAIWIVEGRRLRWFCAVQRAEALAIAVRLREVCRLAAAVLPYDWTPS